MATKETRGCKPRLQNHLNGKGRVLGIFELLKSVELVIVYPGEVQVDIEIEQEGTKMIMILLLLLHPRRQSSQPWRRFVSPHLVYEAIASTKA